MQRRVSQSMKKLLSLFSTMFTSAEFSEVVGVDLAGGRETKQPVEYSVESEVAAQLEIGVGQLDRSVEEEGKDSGRCRPQTAKGTSRMKTLMMKTTRAFSRTAMQSMLIS